MDQRTEYFHLEPQEIVGLKLNTIFIYSVILESNKLSHHFLTDFLHSLLDNFHKRFLPVDFLRFLAP